jgi:hypothetical protein
MSLKKVCEEAMPEPLKAEPKIFKSNGVRKHVDRCKSKIHVTTV